MADMLYYQTKANNFLPDGDNSKVKLATLVEGDSRAPFSRTTTPRCKKGRYALSWIAPLYP